MTSGNVLSRRRCRVVLAGALLLLMLAPPASAQTFNDAFVRALSNNCGGLSGVFGPRLTTICAVPPFGAVAATGVLSIDTRGAGGEEQRILKRLKERRDGDGAADSMELRGLGLFVSGDYQSFQKGVTKFEPGYDRDTWAGTVGADYSFAGAGVVGLAVNYSHADGTFKQRGGTFDVDAYGATLYGSVLPIPNLFVDMLAGYTRRDYTVERRYSFVNTNVNIPAAIARGDTNGNEFKTGVNAGHDFVFGRFTTGPRVGFNFRENHIDSYAERGGTGLEVAYDGQHQTSFTSNVGAFGSMAISTGFGVLIPQTTFEWVHEFEDKQRVTYFHFVEDLGRARLRFQTDTPDRDYFNAGVGLVLVLPGGYSPFFNFRDFFGYRHQSSQTYTVGIRFAF